MNAISKFIAREKELLKEIWCIGISKKEVLSNYALRGLYLAIYIGLNSMAYLFEIFAFLINFEFYITLAILFLGSGTVFGGYLFIYINLRAKRNGHRLTGEEIQEIISENQEFCDLEYIKLHYPQYQEAKT